MSGRWTVTVPSAKLRRTMRTCEYVCAPARPAPSDTTKPIPTPDVESDPGTYVGVPDVSEIYPWLQGEEFAIFLLYLLSLMVLFLHERYAGASFAQRLRKAAAALPPRPTPEEQAPQIVRKSASRRRRPIGARRGRAK